MSARHSVMRRSASCKRIRIVVHKVEGQERKYSDNNSNGAHPSVYGLNYFSTENLV
jgi:hypothetical protein